MEAAIFMCLRRHNPLIIYEKMKQIWFEKYFALKFYVYILYNNKGSFIQEILWLYAKIKILCILITFHSSH